MAKTYFATQEWVKEQIEGIKPSGMTFSGSITVGAGKASGSPSGSVTFAATEISTSITLPDGISNIIGINISISSLTSPSSVLVDKNLTEPGVQYTIMSGTPGMKAHFNQPSPNIVTITISNAVPTVYRASYVIAVA